MIFFIAVKLYVNLGCHIFRSINLEKMSVIDLVADLIVIILR